MSSDVNDNNYQVELVKRACKGDSGAFHEIVGLYRKKVYFIAYDICGDRHEAEDIAQEVFIKVFRFIDKFRFDAKFSSWIHQIAVNTSLDVVRKQKNRSDYIDDTELEKRDSDSAIGSGEIKSPEKATIEEVLHNRVRGVLGELSRQEHSAFVMRYYNGLKHQEIAEVMSLSVNTVKTMLFRGKKKLQKKLAPLTEEYKFCKQEMFND